LVSQNPLKNTGPRARKYSQSASIQSAYLCWLVGAFLARGPIRRNRSYPLKTGPACAPKQDKLVKRFKRRENVSK